ncbi:MAG: protein-disulfide reductase DsbD [Gammaproteobacteria bacterium]|nr:protein-disulfide reductase DsbD [Gammaproteobacteria bacterium]
MLHTVLRYFLAALLLAAIPAQAVSLDELVAKKTASTADFLAVEEAFRFSADAVGQTVYLRWDIAPGYYLYQHRFRFEAEGMKLGAPQFPKGEAHSDEYFGEVTVHRGFLEIPLPVEGSGPLRLAVSWQGCADKGLCYPPVDQVVELEIAASAPGATPVAAASAPPSPENEGSRLNGLLRRGDLLGSLGFFLLAGLGLAFTPCVFPMLPIVASLVAGQKAGPGHRARGFFLSLAYVQGMALSFAALGVVAASAGYGLAGLFQAPWMVALVCALFVALALSLFGLYELRLPSVLLSRASALSNRQAGGTYLGAALMGVLGTLVVSPCVTAPLAAAMLHIAQTGDRVLGGLALYALAMGMGLPLLLLGLGGDRLLPRAGAWMDGIKSAFGVGLLALALYLGSRFLPGSLVLLLWGGLCVVSAVYLGAFARDRESKWTPLRQGLGLVLFAIGIAQTLGAAMGHADPLAPLSGLSLGASAQAQATASPDLPRLTFRRFKTVEELDRLLAEAKQAGKPVMVDFYADWCVACHEFAAKTFPDPAVRPLLERFVLLQADVTANDAEDVRLLKTYSVLGLPTLLFFDAEGRETAASRVTGFLPPTDFAARLMPLLPR